jgi:transposase
MTRYGLRGDQWQRIADLLLGKVGHVGTTARDNRRFVEAVLYRYRAGIPWRPAGTIRRLEKHPPAVQPLGQEGVWQCLFEHLAAEADNEYSTIVRAHQRTAPAHPKKMTTTRLAAARATKIHALDDALGNPLSFCLTPGQTHDLVGANALLPQNGRRSAHR